MATFQSLPGFREFYPEDCAARNGLFNAWRGAARRHGFVEYDAPVLEPLELFTEKSGEEIRSQLFEFEDKGGRKVALRPEMTPSLARLVAAQAGSLRKPIKWFSIGECFRYEKPQKGRGRSFYQLNADILGEPGPGADAECIALLVESLKACGLEEGEFEVRISDRKLWFLFFAATGVQETKVPEALAIVDKWDREPKEELMRKLKPYFSAEINAESIWLSVKKFRLDPMLWLQEVAGTQPHTDSLNVARARGEELKALDQNLKNLGMERFYRFDFSIVRGLAYYTGFVFEAFQTIGTARALAGGGRYDDLLKKLGGVDMPAVGFGMGDMTTQDLLAELKRPIGAIDKPQIYVVMGEGPNEQRAARELVGKLRVEGLSVDYPLGEAKFGKQFKAANQVGATLAIILGQDEVSAGQVKIKDMRSGVEIVTPNDATLVANVREILEKGLPT